MKKLIPGANTSLPSEQVIVAINYTPIASADIDISAFLLTANGLVRGDGDMCFYGQPQVQQGAVKITEANSGKVTFSLNLANLDAAVEKVALTATIYENLASFNLCQQLSLSITGTANTNATDKIEADIPTQGKEETALILGEFYRRNNEWKFRCVAQGFVGGLEPLAKHFGVDIAPAPAAPQPPAAPKPVAKPLNLSKISLDKRQSSISLEKKGGNFGEIKVNLKWNKNVNSKGFLGFNKPKSIDLDVGCLFELKDGYKGAVQALGNSFGQFNNEPYIELLSDDRTGSSTDGEWLRINGNQWQQIKRVLIFAFIYEGAPNWQATDGVINVYVPEQPPIEVRLSEEGGNKGMCAVVLLENINGTVKVTREVKFFGGHDTMDRAYHWGLNWRAGSK